MDDYTIKDSGERQTFASGMQRDTQTGKLLWSLVADGPMLKRWAAHMTAGAAKYEPRNWMKATGTAELERFRESAMRHFMQWMAGERDEDHAAAVMFNINGAEYVREWLTVGSKPTAALPEEPQQPVTFLRAYPDDFARRGGAR